MWPASKHTKDFWVMKFANLSYKVRGCMEFGKQRSERTPRFLCNQFRGLRSKYHNTLGISVNLNDHSMLWHR